MKGLSMFVFCLLSFSLAYGQQSSLTKKEKKEIFLFYGEKPIPEQVILPDPVLYPSGILLEGDQLLRISQEGEVKGYMLRTSAKGRYDYFDYDVFYTSALVVEGVMVTVYRSTHGAAICQKKWLSQFKGYAGGELKLGKEIDAISGATFSATSMVDDMQRCFQLMTNLKEEGVIH